MESPSSANVKTYFNSPEGRYNFRHESESTRIIHDPRCKWVSRLTIAHLKENLTPEEPNDSPSIASSNVSMKEAAIIMKEATMKLFVDIVGTKPPTPPEPSRLSFGVNYDEKGTYLIFNTANWLHIRDNNMSNEQVKLIQFNPTNPLCHAFDSEANNGHDLLIGLLYGEIYTASVRHQLKDYSTKLVGARHYNKNGEINKSHCNCVAWVPGGKGLFVAAHADGNLYVYTKNKDGVIDPSFPDIKDPTQFTVAHAKSDKCNPISRWHVLQGSINAISFSTNGSYLAIVGRDGYLRVFDFHKEELLFGGKSHFGALLCCAWSHDDKYILTGGEDDLVHIWSTSAKKMVSYGEGHHSWVTGISFDSYWLAPNSERVEENVVYRFVSIGEDARLLIWNHEIDSNLELAQCSVLPTLVDKSTSRDSVTSPPSALRPSPRLQQLPKLFPVGGNLAHVHPLSTLIIAEDSVIAISHIGKVKIWDRPRRDETSQAW